MNIKHDFPLLPSLLAAEQAVLAFGINQHGFIIAPRCQHSFASLITAIVLIRTDRFASPLSQCPSATRSVRKRGPADERLIHTYFETPLLCQRCNEAVLYTRPVPALLHRLSAGHLLLIHTCLFWVLPAWRASTSQPSPVRWEGH